MNFFGKYISKKEIVLFCFLLLIGILSSLFIFSQKTDKKPIESDGMGYYAYLPAVFIYKDLSMYTLVENQFQNNIYFGYGISHGDNQTSTSSFKAPAYIDKYPIGVAIMEMPFFLIAHVISILFNQPITGYSNIYEIAIFFAAMTYFLIGLLALKRTLDRYFSQSIVYLTLFAITFATNIFNYAAFDVSFSHIYSFCLISIFILLTVKWHEKITIKRSILLGILAGLIVLVRNTNAIFILFFPIFGIFNKETFKEKIKLLYKYKKHLLLMVITGIIILIPQILYWKYTTNSWIVYSYKNEGFDFLHPQILNILFGVKKGLFFWFPILFFAVIGIYLMFKSKVKGYLLPTVIILLLHLYIISSWLVWWYGGGYGHRGFTEAMSLFVIPLALFFETSLRSKYAKVIITLTILLIILSIFKDYQYLLNIIPGDGPGLHGYLQNFFKLTP